MAVRLTQCPRDEDTYGLPTVRQSVGRALRSRFGFSLIQAPLRTLSPFFAGSEFEVAEQRYQPAPRPVPDRPARPLDEELGLSLLLRGRPVAPRV
jgi:hypothetical protein